MLDSTGQKLQRLQALFHKANSIHSQNKILRFCRISCDLHVSDIDERYIENKKKINMLITSSVRLMNEFVNNNMYSLIHTNTHVFIITEDGSQWFRFLARLHLLPLNACPYGPIKINKTIYIQNIQVYIYKHERNVCTYEGHVNLCAHKKDWIYMCLTACRVTKKETQCEARYVSSRTNNVFFVASSRNCINTVECCRPSSVFPHEDRSMHWWGSWSRDAYCSVVVSVCSSLLCFAFYKLVFWSGWWSICNVWLNVRIYYFNCHYIQNFVNIIKF